MYFCFLFLFSVTAWSGLIGWEELEPFDGTMFYIFLAIWFVLQVWFFGTSYYYHNEEKKKLTMTDEEKEDYFGVRSTTCMWNPFRLVRRAEHEPAISTMWDYARWFEHKEYSTARKAKMVGSKYRRLQRSAYHSG